MVTNYNESIFTWTEDKIAEINKKYPPSCPKCKGTGKLWWHELDLTHFNKVEVKALADRPEQVYPCDKCI